MPEIQDVKLSIDITGVKNLAELKGKLNRIQFLIGELEKEFDSISGVNITFKSN